MIRRKGEMKFVTVVLAALTVCMLSGCRYSPCPRRPMPPAAPGYSFNPGCGSQNAESAYYVKRMYEAPTEK